MKNFRAITKLLKQHFLLKIKTWFLQMESSGILLIETSMSPTFWEMPPMPIDMQGKVTTLHKNGDTDGADGSLDQPCEVIIRGNELIIVSMDVEPSTILSFGYSE